MVLRPEPRRVEDLRSGGDRRGMRPVDVLAALDREREMVQARRVELELLLLERLPQTERARARGREAQVVDLLAALALDEERRLQPERAEHGGVERERALEVAADEVDVPEADEHGPSIPCRRPSRTVRTVL